MRDQPPGLRLDEDLFDVVGKAPVIHGLTYGFSIEPKAGPDIFGLAAHTSHGGDNESRPHDPPKAVPSRRYQCSFAHLGILHHWITLDHHGAIERIGD
jgi:hypothetical protein